MSKKALIFGVTGQDGSYLSELLLSKKYSVTGVMRRSSVFNTQRIDPIYSQYPLNFKTVYGDLLDVNSLIRIIDEDKPDEIYNLAAMSHVAVSFEMAEFTTEVNALAPQSILEHLRRTKSKSKFYQACSSEMFGASPPPQNEETKFLPQSPYGISKVAAFYMTSYYRRAFDLFASNGILFNHESPRRGLNFVTRKITFNLARILKKEIKNIELGNLEARRDWGFAGDYVEAIHLIMQYKEPGDFVVATGENYSIRDFVIKCFELVGLDWEEFVKYNVKNYLRPAEVPNLQGDSSKVRKLLNWKPKVMFEELCKMMLENDLKLVGIKNLDEAKKVARSL